MEVLNLVRPIFRWVFPYISRIHTAYIGEDSSILGNLGNLVEVSKDSYNVDAKQKIPASQPRAVDVFKIRPVNNGIFTISTGEPDL